MQRLTGEQERAIAEYKDCLQCKSDHSCLGMLSDCPKDYNIERYELEAYRAIIGDITLDRLRELVAAERDGRAVVLPCKVGDTVYTIDLDCKDNPDHSLMCFCWNKSCKSCNKAYLRVWENRTKTADTRSIVAEMGLCGEKGGFGKAVFLTRAEAEQALVRAEAEAKGEQEC